MALFAQSLSGSSAEVLLIPSGQTDAGPIHIFVDNDVDGMADEFEQAHGLDPTTPLDALQDPDADGLTNLLEFKNGTDPRNPDTDGDGTDDGSEVLLGTNPLDPTSGGAAVTLQGLRLIPAVGTLTLNSFPALSQATLQLRVEGSLSDGSQVDLTASSRGTTYTASDPAVATIEMEGFVTARAPGSATIMATNRGVSAATNVIVTTFTPRALGVVSIPGFANNVEVQGGVAYVAAGAAGLVVVDAANPSSPRVVATRDTPGNANDVRVSGNLAYVADGASGLQIIDIADPTRPRTLAAVETPGNASDVIVKGNVAYVADGTTGLQIVDVTDPAFARIVGSVDTPGIAYGVDVHELRGLAAVADGFSLQVVDVRTPSSPMILGSVPIPGSSGFGAPPAVDVAVSGVFAFIAAGLGGIEVIDVRDPATPRSLGFTNVFIDAQDVAVLGNLAFAAEDVFVNAVPIFDLRNLTLPPFVGALNFSGAPSFRDDNGTGIAISGSLIFLTGDRTQLTQNGVFGSSALHIGQYTQFNDNGTNAPFVRIAVPADGTSVLEGQQLPVTVEARDDVFVASVELLLNGSVIRTFASPPYQASLSVPLDVTQLTLGARATDLAGNVGLAGPVVLSVVEDTPPTVSITSPQAGAMVLEGQTLTVEAEATDNVGVRDVVFDVNGALQTNTTAPYSATFPIPLGTRDLTIQATARDTLGQTTRVLRTVPVMPDPPPTVVITSPGEGATVVEGSTLTIAADATDNVSVQSVLFTINGAAQPLETTPPFSLQFTVPLGITGLTIEALASDNLGQNTSSLSRVVGVVPDPRTTVIGRVVDSQAQPLANANVSVFNEFAATTDAQGTFAIPGVPTARGDIVAVASATVNGVRFTGRSSPIPPIIGNLTDVGTIVLMAARAVFETDIGPCVVRGDDTFSFVPFPPGFSVPFMGIERQDGVFVGSNGYLTFTAGDRTFTESVARFLSGVPRIAGLWDDLFPGVDGVSCVHANPLSDRFIVTWNRVPEFVNVGMNTFQIVLFADGRIQMGYAGLNARDGLVGISPGGGAAGVTIDYTTQTPFSTTEPVAIYELFPSGFDLDGAFLVFSPQGLGYQVEFIPPPPTTVVGRFVNAQGQPIANATVTLAGTTIRSTTALDGTFSIPNILVTPTLTTIRVFANALRDSTFLFGESAAVTPVPNGLTVVGDILARELLVSKPPVFETDLGTDNVGPSVGCDGGVARALPFAFPFYGTPQSQLFLMANGFLTFGQMDFDFFESISTFLGAIPRIAVLTSDWAPQIAPTPSSGLFFHPHAERAVITWNNVENLGLTGTSTFQATLFADGAIRLCYVSSMIDSGIVGIAPGHFPTLQRVDYTAGAFSTSSATTAIAEEFTFTQGLDLVGSCILLSPNADGGYDVVTVPLADASVPPGADAPPPTNGTFILEGVITGSGPQVGIKICVVVSASEHAGAYTDAAGFYRYEDLPVGARYLEAPALDGFWRKVVLPPAQAGQTVRLDLDLSTLPPPVPPTGRESSEPPPPH
jgi:hypothetical protein